MDTGAEILREFAARYTAAWCSQNAARVAGFYSPDGSLRVNDGETATGREAITSVAQLFMTAFPDLCVVMDDLRLHGDHAEYHWTLTGANTGTGGTGQKVRISGLEKWRLGDDGLIASSQGRFDAADYRRRLEQGISQSWKPSHGDHRDVVLVAPDVGGVGAILRSVTDDVASTVEAEEFGVRFRRFYYPVGDESEPRALTRTFSYITPGAIPSGRPASTSNSRSSP